MEDQRIMDELKELSDKIDRVPDIIQKKVKHEINQAVLMFGLDPDKPLEAQRLVSWVREKEGLEKQVSKRMISNMSDLVFKAFVVIIGAGIIAFYTNSVVSSAIKKEYGLVDTRRSHTEKVEKEQEK